MTASSPQSTVRGLARGASADYGILRAYCVGELNLARLNPNMNEYPPSADPTQPGLSSPRPPRWIFSRIPFLLMLLLAVIVLAYVPVMMERIQYFRTRGELRALHDLAPEMNFKALSKAFTLVYRKIKPSVVHINAYRTIAVRDDLASLLSGNPRTIGERIQASGVIVDPAGYIVTNQHAIEGVYRIEVVLENQQVYLATTVGGDPAVDLAVLKIDASDLIAAELGDSDKVEVGEMVWAIGNPYGFDQTVTAGIISAKNRREHVSTSNVIQEFLQTDAAINPGSSGGPLVDIEGKVIGINTIIVGQGIGLAIPSNVVRDVLYKQLRAKSKVVRSFIGVLLEGEPITPQTAARYNLPAEHSTGALVAATKPGAPAERAGIQPADVIVEYNGQAVTDPNQLLLMIARTPIGAKVPVVIVRNGKVSTLDVTAEERP